MPGQLHGAVAKGFEQADLFAFGVDQAAQHHVQQKAGDQKKNWR